MKLLFISLEFSASTFSGNGIYARSQVRALAQQGAEVLVLAGKPANHNQEPILEGAHGLIEIGLPAWGTLDVGCAWQALGSGAAAAHVQQQVANFQPELVLGVDASSLEAYHSVFQAQKPAFVFMNYRIFSRTARSNLKQPTLDWESAAVRAAALVVVLSKSDADFVRQHLLPPGLQRPVKVLLPALRTDMLAEDPPPDIQLPSPSRENAPAASVLAGTQRHYLTCVVRPSPEKEPERFVEVVEHLAQSGVLQALEIQVFMCLPGDTELVRQLHQRLLRSAPAAKVQTDFMGPTDLAQVFRKSVLVFHPPHYDAYGMSIIEAASQGAPSIVNGATAGLVGATDLLDVNANEIIALDFSLPVSQLTGQVAMWLRNRNHLHAVGIAACHKARSWTEAENAACLLQMLESAFP